VRRLVALLVVPAVVLLQAGTAWAAKNVVTFTETRHNVMEGFVDFDPCFGYAITSITFNELFHITEFVSGPNEGTGHGTITQAGTFEIDPIGDGVPTFTGRFATRAAFSYNRQGVTRGFTFSAVGVAADGTRIRFHTVEHLNRTPGGFEHEFEIKTVSCPL
jgi:hypothetical protein